MMFRSMLIAVSILTVQISWAAPPIIVSKEYLKCVEIAKQVPSKVESKADSNYPYLQIATISDQDSALTACFLKYAFLEKYGYGRCFDVASTLPTKFSRTAASQACFDAFFDKGTGPNCRWAAKQVKKWMKLESDVFDRQVTHTVPMYAPQEPQQTIVAPATLNAEKSLTDRCETFVRTTLAAKMAQQQADLAKQIQDSNKGYVPSQPNRDPEITRDVPNREMSESEKRICATEASLLSTDYEILRSRREKASAPLVAELKSVMKRVPQKIRAWVEIGSIKKAGLLLATFAKELPPSQIVKLDVVNGKFTYKYVAGTETLEGEVSIHAKYDEDVGEILSQVVTPVKGGWDAYLKSNASDGCPAVAQPSIESIASNRTKLSQDAYEQQLLMGDVGSAGSAN